MADSSVRVEVGDADLAGDLAVPDGARGVVLFAHGSGSSRKSPRNRAVAKALQDAGMATLLIDLLTADEERRDAETGHLRFDIALLARRLSAILDWMETRDDTGRLGAGLFGASTGGGAALVAAAHRPSRVRAVVSRGGRPDLAGPALARVACPTLLIVGGADTPVIGMNRDAMTRMTAPVRLEIVPGASHLFEEPGAIDRVAALAGDWFARYLAAEPAAS
jgi:dienelactone hydrolase